MTAVGRDRVLRVVRSVAMDVLWSADDYPIEGRERYSDDIAAGVADQLTDRSDACSVEQHNSRMCELGTKGCTVKHLSVGQALSVEHAISVIDYVIDEIEGVTDRLKDLLVNAGSEYSPPPGWEWRVTAAVSSTRRTCAHVVRWILSAVGTVILGVILTVWLLGY